jgi:hypothetical protein
LYFETLESTSELWLEAILTSKEKMQKKMLLNRLPIKTLVYTKRIEKKKAQLSMCSTSAVCALADSIFFCHLPHIYTCLQMIKKASQISILGDTSKF